VTDEITVSVEVDRVRQEAGWPGMLFPGIDNRPRGGLLAFGCAERPLAGERDADIGTGGIGKLIADV
jgi:hypothetical protein